MNSNYASWPALILSSSAGRLLRITAVLAVLALFIGACGGGDDDEGADGADPAAITPASDGGTTGAPGTGGATGSTGGGEATGSTGGEATGATGSTGGADSGGAPADLADLTTLQSFRWEVEMSGAGAFLASAGIPSVPGADTGEFTASGAYIAPDQAQALIEVGGFEYKQTVKGNEQWSTIAGVTTGPTPATTDAESLIYVSSLIDPDTVFDPETVECGDSENVNGVSAIRCETTEAGNEELSQSIAGPGMEVGDATYVIWIAEDGNYVVRWEVNASGTSNGEEFEWNLVANITDINSVSSIEP